MGIGVRDSHRRTRLFTYGGGKERKKTTGSRSNKCPLIGGRRNSSSSSSTLSDGASNHRAIILYTDKGRGGKEEGGEMVPELPALATVYFSECT